MRKPTTFAALLLATVPTLALAEPGLPDLAAVQAALDAHPSVVAAEARTNAARAEARALARGTHEFNLSTGYTSRSVDVEGQFDEFDAVLSRAIRLPGKARLDRQIGEHGIVAATNRAEDVRHQAALLLAQYWWDWLGASEEAKVDRQAVDNYAAMATAVRRRVALGDAAQLEADQAEAALASARLAAEMSAGRVAVALTRLSTAFPSLQLPEQAPVVPAPVLPESGVASFGAKIIERSHEIAAAVAEADRAGARAERTRQDRLADPSLGIRVFSERAGQERGAGVILSMPLGR